MCSFDPTLNFNVFKIRIIPHSFLQKNAWGCTITFEYFLFLAENVLTIKNRTNLNPQLFKKKCVFLLVTRIVCNEFLLRQVSEAMHPDGILNSELRPTVVQASSTMQGDILTPERYQEIRPNVCACVYFLHPAAMSLVVTEPFRMSNGSFWMVISRYPYE